MLVKDKNKARSQEQKRKLCLNQIKNIVSMASEAKAIRQALLTKAIRQVWQVKKAIRQAWLPKK